MELSITGLLLFVAAGGCLVRVASAAVHELPVELMQSLKLGTNDVDKLPGELMQDTNDMVQLPGELLQSLKLDTNDVDKLPGELLQSLKLDTNDVDKLPGDLLQSLKLDTNDVDKLPGELLHSLKLDTNDVDKLPGELLHSLKLDTNDTVELPAELLHSLKLDTNVTVELPPPLLEEELAQRAVVMPKIRANECNINIRSGMIAPQPVFLETNEEQFYPYSDRGEMVIHAGGSLQMWCSTEFKSFSTELLTATCVGGSTFNVDGSNYDFTELVCQSWPVFVAEETGGRCNGGRLVRVGFRISKYRFVEQMQVCFNAEEEVTRYVRHKLTAASNSFQNSVDRISFQTGGFFGGKNVDKLYTQVTQLETIDEQLGGNAAQYFDSPRNVYLARGHMGAKADFVYGTQQRATFLFINAAPQWQVFNAGNWARIEDGVRSWVAANRLHVYCYTGVWGVTTLPNKDGVETPLYLAYDENNNGLIPVPMLYFRVIIEPARKRGIVFIGVNNPHLTMEQIEADYILCNDVSDEVTYVNWRRTDLLAGYSYACEVEEFLSVVPHLPALTASGGLLV